MQTLQKIGVVLLSLLAGAGVAFFVAFLIFGLGFAWPFGPLGEFLLMIALCGSPVIGLAVAYTVGKGLWPSK